jgi:hypothetical protein
MTHTKDEALKLALEALELVRWTNNPPVEAAITAIKQALAEPVHEPVERPCHVFNVTKTGALTEWEPTKMAFALTDGKHALYTAAQPAQPAHVQKEDLYDLAVKADNWGQP